MRVAHPVSVHCRDMAWTLVTNAAENGIAKKDHGEWSFYICSRFSLRCQAHLESIECLTTMRLYLLRHATAVPRGTLNYGLDAKRPLTEDGHAQAQRIGRGLKRLKLPIEAIVTSPYVRAAPGYPI